MVNSPHWTKYPTLHCCLSSDIPAMRAQYPQIAEQREWPEWLPDWYPTVPPAAQTVPPAEDRVSPGADRGLLQDISGNVDKFNVRQAKTLYVSPSANRMVKRKLKGIHLFMITVNGTIGTGLYWRGGQILELAGPLAAILSFLVVGLLCWAVMQCITEMLCIWPIPGALSVYVTEFVDPELGIAVGIAYWFTYSVSFGALIATLAAEMDFWPWAEGSKLIDGLVYTLVPVILVLINLAGLELYGPFEVVSGTIKIACLAVIIVFLILINVGVGSGGYLGTQKLPPSPMKYDSDAAGNWVIAFLMCLSIATFAYVGVEIVAASALESAPYTKLARTESDNNKIKSTQSRRSNDTLIGNTIKFSARHISFLATVAYSVSGLLVSFDIEWNHCSLPRLSWIEGTRDCVPSSLETRRNTTASAFVTIAAESRIPHLANIFNVFLVFTCITCAGTNLYVASRTLFGLTSRLDGGKGQRLHLRILAWFGRTNPRKVPMRATVFSAVAFCWVPFLQLRGGTSTKTPIGMFVEILAQMGSVPVVIVWACETLAFIRYYHCIKLHRSELEKKSIPQVRRFYKADYNDYPYRGPLQPYLAYFAFAGCLFILIVANGASLWGGFYRFPFLSSYLFVLVFIGVWILLKILRGGKWSVVDLNNPDKVVRKIKNLHAVRMAAA
ncbi:amino acid permease-domain-containing protein [Aspergillus varians]